ncbi:MAG: hypothetical protein LUD74_04795 [Tannerellaceae bacterium]|nr:hypothetical protein [Tannerellaceae bacterium]
MANEEKINLLLTDIKNLGKLVSGVQHAEIYPVSFFSQSFDLSQKIINQLHMLEEEQLEMLREQMEAHKEVIGRIKESVKTTLPIEHIYPENKHVEETPSEQTTENDNTEIIIEEAVPAPAIQDIPEEASSNPEKNNTDPIETVILPSSEKATISLIEVLEKKNLSDFRKAFSLNDRFRFRRELFKGDEELMNQVIAELNEIDSLASSLEYLAGQFIWNQEDEAVKDFIKLLEKRFL